MPENYSAKNILFFIQYKREKKGYFIIRSSQFTNHDKLSKNNRTELDFSGYSEPQAHIKLQHHDSMPKEEMYCGTSEKYLKCTS